MSRNARGLGAAIPSGGVPRKQAESRVRHDERKLGGASRALRDIDPLAPFQREAGILAALNHPNIAQVYGLEKADGQTAIVMELVQGPTIAERMKDGPIPPDNRLVRVAEQIGSALFPLSQVDDSGTHLVFQSPVDRTLNAVDIDGFTFSAPRTVVRYAGNNASRSVGVINGTGNLLVTSAGAAGTQGMVAATCRIVVVQHWSETLRERFGNPQPVDPVQASRAPQVLLRSFDGLASSRTS